MGADGKEGKVWVKKGCSSWLFSAAFALLAFALALAVLSNTFEKAAHELDLSYDATGAPALEVWTASAKPEKLAVLPVEYEGLSCRWDVTIESTGRRNPKSWDAQVWIQSVSTDRSTLAWDSIEKKGDWKLADSSIGAAGRALVTYGEGVPRSLHFSAEGAELKIVFSRHQWTGIVRITVNGETTEIDTWRENFMADSFVRHAPPLPGSAAEDRSGSVFFTVREIGDAPALQVRTDRGSVKLLSARLDGDPLPLKDGTLKLPGYNRLVRLPAVGVSVVVAAAAPFLGMLLLLPFRKAPFWTFAAAATLLKLWMVGGDEILATPYDATGYMLSALHGYWGLPFDAHSFDRQPGYPLLIAAGRLFGVPLRLWLELVYALACLSVASALPRLRFPAWSACLAFALLLFSPQTFPTFSFAYQDAAFTPFFLFFLAAMLHALPRGPGRMAAAAALGAAGALVWNTRPEHILAAGMLAVFGIVILLLDSAENFSFSKADRSASAVLFPALAILAAVTLCLSAANRSGSLGLFATSNFEPEGFSDLYDELLAIDPIKPEAYHPIPRDAREKAYAASPSFAKLRPYLEGPVLATYAPMATTGKEAGADYGVFIFWGLRVAPWYLKSWHNGAELDRYYEQCAGELRAAREKEAYPATTVQLSFVDPRAELWLPHVKEGALAYGRILVKPDAEYLYPEPAGVNTALFDEAALRRVPTAKENQAVWSAPSAPSRRAAKDAAALVSAVVMWTAALVFLPLSVYLALRLRNRNFEPETMLAAATLTLVAAAFLSRFALLSVMHAVAFGAETRYICPVAPLPALVVVTALVTAARAARRRKALPAPSDVPNSDHSNP